VAIFQGASAWVRERSGSAVRSVEGAQAVGSGAAWERLESAGERGGSANGRERGGEVGSEVQEVGSVVPGRSRLEYGSGTLPLRAWFGGPNRGGGPFGNQGMNLQDASPRDHPRKQ
jgi:hypothetical protein